VAFGSWTPDRHGIAVGDSGLVRAEGAVPYGGQYRGFPSRIPITASGAVATALRVRGSIAGAKADGTPFHFSGDAADLYELQSSGLVNVSDAGGYTLSATDKWCFTQYANTIIACAGTSTKAQGFLMGTHADFTDLDDPALPASGGFSGFGTAPTGKYPWVIGHQVFVGHLLSDPTAVQWSVIDNPNSWPTPGSPEAVAGLSDIQALQGGGTKIQAVRGYGEVGGILKEASLWRCDFAGGDIQWAFRQVVPDIGLLIPDLAIPLGGALLFYSAQGWQLWNYGTEIVAVGDGVVDRWFRERVDILHPERISWAVDEDDSLAYVLFPGIDSTDGEPNHLLVYHFPTRQFAVVEGPGIEHVTNAFQPTISVTLESMPQAPLNTLSGSPDDPGQPKKVYPAGYASTTHALGLFRGAAVEMLLETGDIQHATERSMVSIVRPIVDTRASSPSARIAVGARSTRTEDPTWTSEQQQANDGECYFRADGRYHRYRMRVPAGADDIQAMGLEVELEADGSGR
jgi:hypothetical protein